MAKRNVGEDVNERQHRSEKAIVWTVVLACSMLYLTVMYFPPFDPFQNLMVTFALPGPVYIAVIVVAYAFHRTSRLGVAAAGQDELAYLWDYSDEAMAAIRRVKGVRGYLLFLCISLAVITPLLQFSNWSQPGQHLLGKACHQGSARHIASYRL